MKGPKCPFGSKDGSIIKIGILKNGIGMGFWKKKTVFVLHGNKNADQFYNSPSPIPPSPPNSTLHPNLSCKEILK